jgi:hypothetical protein
MQQLVIAPPSEIIFISDCSDCLVLRLWILRRPSFVTVVQSMNAAAMRGWQVFETSSCSPTIAFTKHCRYCCSHCHNFPADRERMTSVFADSRMIIYSGGWVPRGFAGRLECG